MSLELVPLTEELELPALELPEPSTTRVDVLSLEGSPIPGATVLLFPRPRPEVRHQVPVPAWTAARQLSRTDAQGRASFRVPRNAAIGVEVAAEGYVHARAETYRGSRAVLRLRQASRRTLEVIGPGGKPREGVVITLDELRLPLGVTDRIGKVDLGLARGRSSLRLLAADGAALEALLPDRRPAAGKPRPQRLQLEPPNTLEGRVIAAPRREPVAEAVVWYDRVPASFVQTDGRGFYRLPALPWQKGQLRTAAPGFLPERAPDERPSQGPTLVLHPAAAIVGIVVDGDGRSILGANVQTRFDSRSLGPLAFNPPFWQRQSGGRASSDRDGRFRLGNLVPGLEYELRIEAEGYPPQRITAATPEVPRLGEELRIVLDRGVSLVGRVLGPDREPVQGAQVTLGESMPDDVLERARRMETPSPRQVATTDPDGLFEAGPLAPGRLDLEVEAAGFVTATVRGLEVEERHGEEPVDVGTVILSPEATIHGRIVDRDGEPQPGAAVTVVPDEALLAVIQDRGPPAPDGFSTGDGSFEIGGFRSGQQVKLRIDLEGYGLSTVPRARAGGDPVVVRLDPVRDLVGAVTDADGAGIAGALVQVDPLDYLEITGGQIPSAAAPAGLSDRTGGDGRFRIGGISPGLLEVVVTASGWQTWQRRLDPWRAARENELKVVLEPAAVVTGLVVDAGGQPAIGAEIRRWMPPLPEGAVFYEAPLATTDGDGHYRIDDLAPGHVRLEASHGTSGRAVSEIEAVSGESSLDFRLEAAATVSGTVVDAYGGPVAGAQVVVRAPLASWTPPRVVSDGAGHFEIRGLATGHYALEAWKRGEGRTLEPVAFDLHDEPIDGLEVPVAPTGTVSGRLYGLEPEELASIRLHAGPLLDVGSVDHEGSYRISDLSPGAWVIVAEVTSTGRRAMGSVEIDPEDPEAHLDLDLGSGLTLSGLVTLDGEPWPGTAVTAFGPGGVTASTRTGASGQFALSGLRAGDYLLEVVIPDRGVRHRRRLSIDTDVELSIELEHDTATVAADGLGADVVHDH